MQAVSPGLPQAPLTAQLLQELNNAIEERRVEEGFVLLSGVDCKLATMHSPGHIQAPFLLCLAQWVDLGYESPSSSTICCSSYLPGAERRCLCATS